MAMIAVTVSAAGLSGEATDKVRPEHGAFRRVHCSLRRRADSRSFTRSRHKTDAAASRSGHRIWQFGGGVSAAWTWMLTLTRQLGVAQGTVAGRRRIRSDDCPGDAQSGVYRPHV